MGKRFLFQKGRLDIFNGHIKNPGEIIFSYIFGFIMIIVMAIILIFGIFSVSYSEENTEQHTLAFTDCEANGDDLRLFPSEGCDCYVIKNYKEYVKNIDSLKLNCDGKSEFVVRAVHHTSKIKPPYYWVCNLSSGDRTYYNFDAANHFAERNKFYIALVFLAFIILYIAILILSIIAGRNPQKHYKLIHFVFKKGYILQQY